MAKVPTMIRLDEELKAAIEEIAAQEDRSMSNVIGRVMKAWLDERRGGIAKPAKSSAAPARSSRAAVPL